MKVLITGASGFIGRALSQRLTESGYEAIPLVRGEPAPGARTWNPGAGRIDDDALAGIDAVVHLAGESIGGRWTPAKKQAILSSRIEGTELVANAVAAAKPAVFVCGSAIGFYGSRGEEVLTEQSAAGSGFLADVTVAWEQAARPAVDAGVRTVLARTALVLEDEGGSFPRMLLPFKFGIGGPLGSGRQWWAWITLEDEVRAIMHCLGSDGLEGPVNLASPNPVRNGDFGKALGKALRRPAVLPAPGFGLKLLLGGEFADEVLLASQRVVPTRLEQSGFEFSHPHLPAALDAVLA
jgi:uncharacterized protein